MESNEKKLAPEQMEQAAGGTGDEEYEVCSICGLSVPRSRFSAHLKIHLGDLGGNPGGGLINPDVPDPSSPML